MIFSRNARSFIRNAYLSLVGKRISLASTLAKHGGIVRGASFPHVRLAVQPDCSSRRSELRCILQQIRYDPLYLGGIKGKPGHFIIAEEIQRQAPFLKPKCQQPAT